MEGKKRQTVLAAAMAGLLAAVGAAAVSAETQTAGAPSADGKAPCYGINKCKGTGACGGKGHSCAGSNACKGQGYLELEKDTCLKIEGGRLTPEAQPS